MITILVLMLAGAEAADQAATLEPPKVKLICRYDPPAGWFFSRRRMCLTPSEWEERDRRSEEASRRMPFEYLGDTNCMNGGICTS